MIKNNLAKLHDGVTNEELDNLKNNILRKIAQLNISLPELAKLMNVEYQNLRRIVNSDGNYYPNLRMLYPIADFFEVSISDLLKNPKIPQYVPLLNISEVERYLNERGSFAEHELIFCEEYIHSKAFAMSIEVNQFGIKILNTFILKPYKKITSESFLLIENKRQYFFVKIIEKNQESVKTILIPNEKLVTFKIAEVNTIGIAVKQILNNDLL